jgi:hypothetical protein
MLVDKVKTDIIPTWKAEILRKEHTNEVLEKIKAELIKYLSDYDFGTGYQNDVAMIIDKYIEGSESE